MEPLDNVIPEVHILKRQLPRLYCHLHYRVAKEVCPRAERRILGDTKQTIIKEASHKMVNLKIRRWVDFET